MYAHTKQLSSGEFATAEEWEPLFSAHCPAVFGHLIAYGIAGHHSGMLDAKNDGVSQQTRLSKTVCFKDDDAPESLRNRPLPPLPACLQDSLKAKDSFPSAFFIRMLFSCLVDADFLATEAFMNDSGLECPKSSTAKRAHRDRALGQSQNRLVWPPRGK